MKYRKTTPSTVCRDLRAFADFLAEAGHAERAISAKWLNEMLNDFLDNDVFGTEGQCDPRGDHRK